MPDRRNVLFIVIDQLRADCVFGDLSAHVSLPNIRALADESVSFENHFSVATPCGPSRVSLLTGQYAMNHRAVRNGTPLRYDTPTLATEAQKAGYEPLLFGYTDTSQDPRHLPPDDPRLFSYEEVAPGFTEALRMRTESDCTAWEAHLRAKGYDLPGYPDIYRPSGDSPASPAQYAAEDSDTSFLADRFLADISTRSSGWFAFLAFSVRIRHWSHRHHTTRYMILARCHRRAGGRMSTIGIPSLRRPGPRCRFPDSSKDFPISHQTRKILR